MVASLQVGEGVEIDRTEWKLKTSPADYFSHYGAQIGQKLTARTFADGTGWAILRVA